MEEPNSEVKLKLCLKYKLCYREAIVKLIVISLAAPGSIPAVGIVQFKYSDDCFSLSCLRW